LELSSISSYILAGFRRDSMKSSEASLKYFLLGSFATAFFLYGIALVYGATGTTNLGRMDNADPGSNLLKLGLSLILIGIGFKVAAAPFQIWTPDVYEGAPTPVTALFSAGPKAAAFALLLRIFASVPAATHFWFWAFWVLAILTMFAGNLGALLQTNVKIHTFTRYCLAPPTRVGLIFGYGAVDLPDMVRGVSLLRAALSRSS